MLQIYKKIIQINIKLFVYPRQMSNFSLYKKLTL